MPTSLRVPFCLIRSPTLPSFRAHQLVEDSGGFRTFSSRGHGSGSLSLRGETIVGEHIGRLYTAFLNTTSTLDWVRFLVEVEELPDAASSRGGGGGSAGGEGHGVIFQKYDMPWPVKDREVVIRRSVRLDKRAKKMIATCEPGFCLFLAWCLCGRLPKRAGTCGPNEACFSHGFCTRDCQRAVSAMNTARDLTRNPPAL